MLVKMLSIFERQLTKTPFLLLSNKKDKFTVYCDAFRKELGCV